MTTTQIALNKKAHPLMMHLSILPKYDITAKETFSYDPTTQTSNIKSMDASTCHRQGSWRSDD
ncbi:MULTISPECIES: hypothetical protein [unclassified Microcoleus]|uniref:hypothetical protein n=1 Tax=unclassified Microcoleus TaxID=2642155 RepID=UPI002FCEC880